MSKYVDAPLPQDAEGRTYVTDQMLANDPGLAEFLRRTSNSWVRDEHASRYVLSSTGEEA